MSLFDHINAIASVGTRPINDVIDKADNFYKNDLRKLKKEIQKINDIIPDDFEDRRDAALYHWGYVSDISPRSFLRQLGKKGRVKLSDADIQAAKRILYIFDGPFDAESEYYTIHPSQWVRPVDEGGGGLSKPAAKELYRLLDDPPDMRCISNLDEKDFPAVWIGRPWSGAPRCSELLDKGVVIPDAPEVKNGFRVSPAPFNTGGLTLPDCVDYEVPS